MNTEKSTVWALRVFHEWKSAQNKSVAVEGKGDDDLLDNPNVVLLNFWIPQFIAEVRNKKGEPYPPKTIHQILAGMQHRMLDSNPSALKFLEASFKPIDGICDTVYRDLHFKGIGTEVRHASLSHMRRTFCGNLR